MSTARPSVADDPVLGAIVEENAGRDPALVRLKYGRMGADPFSFFRGTDHLFAASWSTLKPVDPGPAILTCGDLHLENFGGFRDDEGRFTFDINDFDQASILPVAFDLTRCATSIILAAEVWGLSPIQAMRTALGFKDAYLAVIAGEPAPDDGDETPIDALVGRCALGSQAELLGELTRVDGSGRPSIRRSSGKFPPVGKAVAKLVSGAVEAHGKATGRPASFEVLDVAGRIAGIGSLGVRRYVALVAGDGSEDGARLLDVKEVGPCTVLACSAGPMPSDWGDDARRVVDAQRRLQERPTAGLAVLEVDGRGFRLREMIPDENRATLDRYRRKPAKLRKAVEAAGRITARSHLRGARLDSGDRTSDLVDWAAGPGLGAVLASAARFADRNRSDFKRFRKAGLDPEG